MSNQKKKTKRISLSSSKLYYTVGFGAKSLENKLTVLYKIIVLSLVTVIHITRDDRNLCVTDGFKQSPEVWYDLPLYIIFLYFLFKWFTLFEQSFSANKRVRYN